MLHPALCAIHYICYIWNACISIIQNTFYWNVIIDALCLLDRIFGQYVFELSVYLYTYWNSLLLFIFIVFIISSTSKTAHWGDYCRTVLPSNSGRNWQAFVHFSLFSSWYVKHIPIRLIRLLYEWRRKSILSHIPHTIMFTTESTFSTFNYLIIRNISFTNLKYW